MVNTRLKVKVFRINKNEYYLAIVCNFLSLYHRCQTVYIILMPSQPAITCSKLTIETLEQGVKYVQS